MIMHTWHHPKVRENSSDTLGAGKSVHSQRFFNGSCRSASLLSVALFTKDNNKLIGYQVGYQAPISENELYRFLHHNSLLW